MFGALCMAAGYGCAVYRYLLVPSSAQCDARIRREACQGIVHYALARMHLVCWMHWRIVAHLLRGHRDCHVVR